MTQAQIPSADSAVPFPLTIARGTTKRIPLRLKSRGAPVDLTGYTALLQARENPKATAVLIELSTENGGIVIDGPAGAVTLIFDTAITAALNLPGEYDLMLYDAAGEGTRIIYGAVTPLWLNTRKPA